MPISLLKSKTYIPPVKPGLVLRPRLIKRLQAGLDYKLTLISAPAGFGKTVLLSEWIAGCGKSAAWISLDKGDNDPVRFLAYFIAALQQIRPETGVNTRVMLDSAPFAASRQPAEALLSGLVNEIAEITRPFIMVLDDYHSISEPAVHETIKFIIENQPQAMHLVISSRADPPLPLARLRARRQLNELRVNELRFTLEEAAAFLNLAMKLDLKPEDLALLEERTEGWIAGLQMAALSLQGRKDSQDFVTAFAGSHHFISDFLVEEVLNQQTADTREFLLKTSIL
jgi:LuxR family transcriptional regulator, maltose regulon positive regulatory protein